MEKPEGVVTKLNLDGTENAKYVDLLDEDKPCGSKICLCFLCHLKKF